MRHPELNGCDDRHQDADDEVDLRRGGAGEAQNPGRYQDPQPDDQVELLFPLEECRQRRDRQHGDDQTADHGVLSLDAGIEADDPGRDQQKRAQDQIEHVTGAFISPFHDDLLSEGRRPANAHSGPSADIPNNAQAMPWLDTLCAMPGPEEREVYFEFITVGNAVKVTAIDSLTGIEVSAMGPASATQMDLKQLALQKLKARLKREEQP
jgi:hypothetical protein